MNDLRFQSRIGEALSVGCAILIFVAMFDHVMAIKYVDLGVLVVVGAWCAGRSLLKDSHTRPLLLPLGLWAIWTLMSASWSADLAVSAHAWFDEVGYPLTGFYVFWLAGQQPQHVRRLQMALWAACLILAGISVAYFHLLDPALPKPGLLHFYPRVGHTSTLALMAIPALGVMAANANTRIRGLTGIVFCVIIGGATLNRFFWAALAVVVVILQWPHTPNDRKRAACILSALFVSIVIAAGISNKLRLATVASNATLSDTVTTPVTIARSHIGMTLTSLHTEDLAARPVDAASHRHVGLMSGFLALRAADRAIAADTRPQIWRFYGSQVLKHPWIGIGFGKPLPSIAYGSLIPASLVELDENVRTHAHNLFLNTLLQVGVVGLALEIIVFASLAYRFFVARKTHPLLYRAGLALVVGMITKNLTDDFMWESTMLMFWCSCGWLMGMSSVQTNQTVSAK
jgi:O-Antigen ligase